MESSSPGSVKWRLQCCQADLLDMLESRFELPIEMFAAKILSQQEYSKIQSIKNVYDRNEYILALLNQKVDVSVDAFVKCLKRLQQAHVAHYIEYPNIPAGNPDPL